MGVSKVRDFLAKVRSDAALQERFRKLYAAEDLPGLAGMANELGFTITKEDYQAAVAEDLKKLHESGRLSEADLQAIAGGVGGPGSPIPTHGVCGSTMGQTCTQNTIGFCGGPSIGTPNCSEVTCA